MALRRYARSPILGAGKFYGTSLASNAIRSAVQAGTLRVKVTTLHERDRLDIIAGREYGDARNWWIIAAASGIGWALQVPPGTRIVIPLDLSAVADLIA
jgi:hypothetical protein